MLCVTHVSPWCITSCQSLQCLLASHAPPPLPCYLRPAAHPCSLAYGRQELLQETLTLRRQLLTLQQEHLATLQQVTGYQQQVKRLQMQLYKAQLAAETRWAVITYVRGP